MNDGLTHVPSNQQAIPDFPLVPLPRNLTKRNPYRRRFWFSQGIIAVLVVLLGIDLATRPPFQEDKATHEKWEANWRGKWEAREEGWRNQERERLARDMERQQAKERQELVDELLRKQTIPLNDPRAWGKGANRWNH